MFGNTPNSGPSEMGVVSKKGVAPMEFEKSSLDVFQMNHQGLVDTLV